MKDLNNFTNSQPSYAFVSNTVWKLFFDIRSFIQSYNGIELSEYIQYTDPRGVLIKANCRDDDHDVILFYVPNFILFGSQPFFYIEYMMTLHGLMLLQGFNSPAIFIMEFYETSKHDTMEKNLLLLINSWMKINEQYPNAKIILCGESMGANLILSFLLYRTKMINVADVDLANEEEIVLPFGSLLISPILEFGGLNTDSNIDILKPHIISSIASFYCTEKNSFLYNPTSCSDMEIWNMAVPTGGMVLSWGDKELQAKKYNQFATLLSQTGRVKFIKSKNKAHCWQFLSFLTEDSQDEKEDSCFALAGILSRLVLFHTIHYKDPNLAYEPMNVLTIDDDHL